MADNDRLAGKTDEGLGAAKEKFGELTGNREMAAEGNAQKNKGRVQNAWGRMQEAADDAADAANDIAGQ